MGRGHESWDSGPVPAPSAGWELQDRSPGSHATDTFRHPWNPSRGGAPVGPSKVSQAFAGVHTVAGQRRSLTCFPKISCMYYVAQDARVV